MGGGENRALAAENGKNVSDQFNINVNHIDLKNFDFSFSAQNPNGLKEDDYIEFEVINGFTATTNDIMKNLNADFIKKIIFLDGSWSFGDMFVGGRADIP